MSLYISSGDTCQKWLNEEELKECRVKREWILYQPVRASVFIDEKTNYRIVDFCGCQVKIISMKLGMELYLNTSMLRLIDPNAELMVQIYFIVQGISIC